MNFDSLDILKKINDKQLFHKIYYELGQLLCNYCWQEFNDSYTRAMVVKIFSGYLLDLENINSYSVICDENINTPTVVDSHNIFVLVTYNSVEFLLDLHTWMIIFKGSNNG